MRPKAQITITREIEADEDAYESGDLFPIGVCARASIKVPYGCDWIIASISSPGVWGIERDADESYLNEVFANERETLLEMLNSLREYEIIEATP